MLYSAPARLLSLMLALTLAGLLTLYPLAVARLSHGELSLMVLGVCAGFVHGVGFDPESRAWRVVFSPVTAWLLMGMGVIAIVLGK